MISFIIIGINIQKTIALCIESVIRFININEISAYEIIYVDSNSTDNTIKIVQNYNIRVILIKGEVNAAIGRNVGVKHSSGNILFFVDGDMELLPDFYKYVFDTKTEEPEYPFVYGYWQDKLYDSNFKYLFTQDVSIPDKPIFVNTTGGLMIIERFLWDKVGGMDERLIRSQDHDIGLRLAKIGFPAKRYNSLFAIHHTISYTNKKRFKKFFLSKILLSQGLLMRKQLFNVSYLKRYYRNVTFVLLLVFMLLFSFSAIRMVLVVLLAYFFTHIIRVIKNYRENKAWLLPFFYYILYPIYTLVGLFFYYPRKPKYTVRELFDKIVDTQFVKKNLAK
jgi:glycosyltransferase involved in cell wall biosynthesis